MSVEPPNDLASSQPTASPAPLLASQSGAISKSQFLIGLGLGWILVGVIALAVFGQNIWQNQSVRLSTVVPAPATASKQWTAAIVWKAPDGADDAIKSCKNWTCLYGVLQRSGAPADTVEFLHAQQQAAPTDDLGYPIAFRGSGRVKSVEIFDPGLGMDGATEFVFVNGPDGTVRPKIDINQATATNATYQQFRAAYPQVTPWDGMTYITEVVSPDGAQQYQFKQTLLNGCHACAVLGTLRLGFNFESSGRYVGMSVLGIDPEKDASFNALRDELAQKSAYYQTLNLVKADGNIETASTQTIISDSSPNYTSARCKFSINSNPNMLSGYFTLDETFSISDVTIQRTSYGSSDPQSSASNALTISCNNSATCISPIFSDRRGLQSPVSAISFFVPQENVDTVISDFQKMQSICAGN